MKKIIITAWVTLVLALAFGVPAAQACSSPPPVPPITVQLHEQCFPIDDPTDCMLRGWITYHNYTTFGSTQNTFCSCALKKVGKIKKVLWVKFIDPITGKRYPAWYFDPDAGVTSNAQQFLGTGANIAGYRAETCEDVPTGTPLDLMLEVIFEGDAGIATIASALNNSGPVLVTGEVNKQGQYIGHVGVVPQKSTTCQVQNKMTAYVGDAISVWADRGVELNPDLMVACADALISPVLLKPAVMKGGDSIGTAPLVGDSPVAVSLP